MTQVLMMLDDTEAVKFSVGESYVDLTQEDGIFLALFTGIALGVPGFGVRRGLDWRVGLGVACSQACMVIDGWSGGCS